MHVPGPLTKAALIRRYKRFLADATLPSGETITAHVANPGSMMGLSAPGAAIWLSESDDPKRKLRYSWELIELGGGRLSGVSTAHPNRIVDEALAAKRIPPLEAYETRRREVRYGEASRVDFLLTQPGLPDAYVEVKNVHLRRDEAADGAEASAELAGLAEFPDAVTARGAKHLRELAAMVAAGHRAVMIYLIQRDDCDRLALAADIDPQYVEAYKTARAAGVEAYAYVCAFSEPMADGYDVSLTRSAPILEPGDADGRGDGASA